MDFFDKAKEVGSAALEKGKVVGSAALEKGKDLAQVAKLNIDIATLEAKISEKKKSIGNIIVTEKIKIDNDEIKNDVKEIDKLQKEIAEKKEEIKKYE